MTYNQARRLSHNIRCISHSLKTDFNVDLPFRKILSWTHYFVLDSWILAKKGYQTILEYASETFDELYPTSKNTIKFSRPVYL